MRIRFARAAAKHGVTRSDIEHVIEHCGLSFEHPPPKRKSAGRTPRLLFLGDDTEGSPLEVIAIEVGDDVLLVIHAMRLRDRYRDEYEEAARWRR